MQLQIKLNNNTENTTYLLVLTLLTFVNSICSFMWHFKCIFTFYITSKVSILILTVHNHRRINTHASYAEAISNGTKIIFLL